MCACTHTAQPSCRQVLGLFKRAITLPRSTAKLLHKGEWFEVTSFRGIKRGADLQSASLDAGGG